MSLTSAVPGSLPSDLHSSCPWTPSYALKNKLPSTVVKSGGPLPRVFGGSQLDVEDGRAPRRSCTVSCTDPMSDGRAAVILTALATGVGVKPVRLSAATAATADDLPLSRRARRRTDF